MSSPLNNLLSSLSVGRKDTPRMRNQGGNDNFAAANDVSSAKSENNIEAGLLEV